MKRKQIIVLCLAVAIGSLATLAASVPPDPVGPQETANAAPPVPPPSPPRLPMDIGACCYGPPYGTIWVIRRWECEQAVNSPSDSPGLFVKGTFSGTEDVNPCDMLPGGYD